MCVYTKYYFAKDDLKSCQSRAKVMAHQTDSAPVCHVTEKVNVSLNDVEISFVCFVLAIFCLAFSPSVISVSDGFVDCLTPNISNHGYP